MLSALRRIAAFCMSVALCFGLIACGGNNAVAPTISDDDMAIIQRQAQGFLQSEERLPELAKLVSDDNWVFTRNLIHGPMQEVGKEMLYINQRLLPDDRAEANRITTSLKKALADLDEAAKMQDTSRMQKAYGNVAAGFSEYSSVIPSAAESPS